MKDFFMQFANFFNKSGTLNTVVWFSVLLLACIICAMSRKKELAAVIAAGAVCFFVSFSSLSMGIQAIIFAAIVIAWLFGTKLAGQEKSKAEAPDVTPVAPEAEPEVTPDEAPEVTPVEAPEAETEDNSTEEENVKNG